MEAEEGMALLEYAMERETDALIFQRWVQSGSDRVISFDDFKTRLRNPPQDKPETEILEDVGNILDAFQQGGEA